MAAITRGHGTLVQEPRGLALPAPLFVCRFAWLVAFPPPLSLSLPPSLPPSLSLSRAQMIRGHGAHQRLAAQAYSTDADVHHSDDHRPPTWQQRRARQARCRQADGHRAPSRHVATVHVGARHVGARRHAAHTVHIAHSASKCAPHVSRLLRRVARTHLLDRPSYGISSPEP